MLVSNIVKTIRVEDFQTCITVNILRNLKPRNLLRAHLSRKHEINTTALISLEAIKWITGMCPQTDGK